MSEYLHGEDLMQALQHKLAHPSRAEHAKAVAKAVGWTLALTAIGAVIVLYGLQLMGLGIEFNVISWCGTALVLTGLRLVT